MERRIESTENGKKVLIKKENTMNKIELRKKISGFVIQTWSKDDPFIQQSIIEDMVEVAERYEPTKRTIKAKN